MASLKVKSQMKSTTKSWHVNMHSCGLLLTGKFFYGSAGQKRKPQPCLLPWFVETPPGWKDLLRLWTATICLCVPLELSELLMTACILMSEKNDLGHRKPSPDVFWKRQWQCEGGAPDLETDDCLGPNSQGICEWLCNLARLTLLLGLGFLFFSFFFFVHSL